MDVNNNIIEAIKLFLQGNNYRSYLLFGAHPQIYKGQYGVRFAVYAPHARAVNLVGDFNHWQGKHHPMRQIGSSGVWQIFVPGLKPGCLYKYEIHPHSGEAFLKADPYAFHAEVRPATASRVATLDYQWHDDLWQQKKSSALYDQPLNIYELHLGSWKRKSNGDFLNFRELANQLVKEMSALGYTHVELLPITEHPYDGSWGYQTTGYFAPTSRYGDPQDFMYFVDTCHRHGIGVILDWVPGHFCKDAHGLIKFDGEALYEHENPLRSENRQWGTLSFDFSKQHVVSFLISNAIFWLDVYHVDGLRVDAVSQMLYLDFDKHDGQWLPNVYGGNENLEAIAFLKKLNEVVFKEFPHTLMIAEESSNWPQVTKPTYVGGLGFNYKWNMGWMNDVLRYMEMDPIHRKWHHNLLTFSFTYAFSENYILSLSHDEVTQGKRSLLSKMPGDYWQKFAGLRLLYGYMYTHPGKKLLFMGAEFGQFSEWQYQKELDWQLLDYEMHYRLYRYVRDLNAFYLKEKALWQLDHQWQGFEWIDPQDYSQSVITFMRKGYDPDDFLVVVANFTPVVRENYRIGVPRPGIYQEVWNSDLTVYGGSGQQNERLLPSQPLPWHNRQYSLVIKLPPLAVICLKRIVKPQNMETNG